MYTAFSQDQKDIITEYIQEYAMYADTDCDDRYVGGEHYLDIEDFPEVGIHCELAITLKGARREKYYSGDNCWDVSICADYEGTATLYREGETDELFAEDIAGDLDN